MISRMNPPPIPPSPASPEERIPATGVVSHHRRRRCLRRYGVVSTRFASCWKTCRPVQDSACWSPSISIQTSRAKWASILGAKDAAHRSPSQGWLETSSRFGLHHPAGRDHDVDRRSYRLEAAHGTRSKHADRSPVPLACGGAKKPCLRRAVVRRGHRRDAWASRPSRPKAASRSLKTNTRRPTATCRARRRG